MSKKVSELQDYQKNIMRNTQSLLGGVSIIPTPSVESKNFRVNNGYDGYGNVQFKNELRYRYKESPWQTNYAGPHSLRDRDVRTNIDRLKQRISGIDSAISEINSVKGMCKKSSNDLTSDQSKLTDFLKFSGINSHMQSAEKSFTGVTNEIEGVFGKTPSYSLYIAGASMHNSKTNVANISEGQSLAKELENLNKTVLDIEKSLEKLRQELEKKKQEVRTQLAYQR